MQALKRLDIFPKFDAKFEEDAREKTIFGAALSLFALVCIVFLTISEMSFFFSIEQKHELYVDPDTEGQLDIKINVTFPAIPCDLISLDAVDSFGEFQKEMDKKSIKHRVQGENGEKLIEQAEELIDTKAVATVPIDSNGQPKKDCGSCYGAESHPGQCCNTCSDVRQAYEKRGWSFHLTDVSIVQCAKERLQRATALSRHEGCNIFGKIRVARVQGNVHFVPGRSFVHLGQHMHDLTGEDLSALNLSHVIHQVQFGEEFPGVVNPLDGVSASAAKGEDVKNENGKHQYFIKVVPTRFESLSGLVIETNQYSVTSHFSSQKHDESFVPGVFLVYDLSPIKVHIYEARPYPSVAHFLLQLCAITGGVFTVMGLIDALFHHGARRMKMKMQIGKLT